MFFTLKIYINVKFSESDNLHCAICKRIFLGNNILVREHDVYNLFSSGSEKSYTYVFFIHMYFKGQKIL